jgi:hypothetical protein
MITRERLKELMLYEPDTGNFIHRIAVGNRKAGTFAGSIRTDGYRAVTIDGVAYKAHRLAFLYMIGRWPFPEGEHKNTNRSDNRWNNLREATKSQNKRNSRIRADSRNQFKGVRREHRGLPWSARIWVDGKDVRLGSFTTEQAAADAYKVAALRYFGEFANPDCRQVSETAWQTSVSAP